MGSCVSHCSPRPGRHSPRINQILEDPIEGTSKEKLDFPELDPELVESRGELLKLKLKAGDQASDDLAIPEHLSRIKEFSGATESRMVADFSSSDIREQINIELKVLRAQLVRSHALLTYLQVREKMPYKSCTPDSLKEKSRVQQIKSDLFPQRSFDGQMGANFHMPRRRNSSNASHRYSPYSKSLHTQSCPVLLTKPSKISQCTQTDLNDKNEANLDTSPEPLLKEVISHRYLSIYNKEQKVSEFSSTSEISAESTHNYYCGHCEIYSFKEDTQSPQFPRHRTNSFLAAVNSSKTNLASTLEENNGNHLDNRCTFSSSASKDVGEMDTSTNNREFLLPRKLPVLLEEDHKVDTNIQSNHSNRTLCNVHTQTLSPDSNDQPYFPVVSEGGSEQRQHQGVSIIAQVVQKRTAFSEELPQEVVRYPPPYHIVKSRYRSTENISLKESLSHNPQMLKWATVSESLSSKYEGLKSSSRLSSRHATVGTRHLSLEKQESNMSYEPNWCTENPLSPAIEVSSSSTTKFNVFPERNSQTPSQKNRVVKIIDHQEPTSSQTSEPKSSTPSRKGNSKDNSITDSDQNENKNKKNDKERIVKTPQRSMRRGSGAGSPNSLTSIPRYPAFDFSEQEDDHSVANPANERNAHHDKKLETLQKMHVTKEVSDSDALAKSPDIAQKDSSQKKTESSKSMTLMPDAVENSETESAKGSFEYEPADASVNVEQPPPLPIQETAFPNLPNSLLYQLGISKDNVSSVENFDEHELENKFSALSLAFKTDKTTLKKRLELQKHQRDSAENDVENEVIKLRKSLQYLHTNAASSEVRDMVSQIQNQVNILCQATSKISARSETYGAVKQEERVSRAFEVMMLHVENLKRMFDREHRELEETKRMLSGSQAPRRDFKDGTFEERKRSLKTFGIAVGSIKSVVRRASVADFHQCSVSEKSSTVNFSQSWSSGFKEAMTCPVSTLCSYSPSYSLGMSSSSPSAFPRTSVVQPCNKEQDCRRCSLPANSSSAFAALSIMRSVDLRNSEMSPSGRLPGEFKISAAPILCPVVDEKETSDPEDNEEMETNSLIISKTNDPPEANKADFPWHQEELPRSNNRCFKGEAKRLIQKNVDWHDEVKCVESVAAAENAKMGYFQSFPLSTALHIWKTTNNVALIRYIISFIFGVVALIVFFVTFFDNEGFVEISSV